MYPDMGVLRLFLAISVLCTHLGVVHAHTNTIFGCTFLPGDVAIETFFMVSGFYMALVLHEKYVGPGSYSIFITQRILRLAPTYVAALLITVGILALIMRMAQPGHMASKSLFFWHDHLPQVGFFPLLWVGFSNVFVVGLNELFFFGLNVGTGSLVPYFPTGPGPAVAGTGFLLNPPAWSISLEIYFYLLAPGLVRSSLWLQGGLVFASVALRFFLGSFLHWPDDPFIYRNFFCQLGFFMIGSLCYQFYIRYEHELERWGRALRHGFWPLGILALFYRRLPGAHELYPVALPILCCSIPLLFALTRHSRIDRFLGELSYPFYLIHFVVLVLAYFLRDYLAMVWVGPFTLVLTLFLSWMLFHYIETRSERFRERIYHRQRPRTKLSLEYFPLEVIEPGGKN